MTKFEDELAQLVKDNKIPHAVVFATNKDGSFTYKHTVGSSIFGDSKPIAEDAVFLLASSTKLLTSIAALQIVEKGLFGLDDDVSTQLPELAKQPILKGFDSNDKPILEKRKNTITLRHLLTHSAGTTYDAMNPDLIKLQSQKGHTPNTGTTVVERFEYPLIFDPGTSWMYGTGIDWAGKVVERVTNQTLEEYIKKNILQPLGIIGFTFFPYENSELKTKVAGLTVRTPDSQLVNFNDPFINTGSKDGFGGHGGYAQGGDYLKIQHSILANDGKLLKPESVELMFTPQLGAESKKALAEFRESPYGAAAAGDQPTEIETDWGIGGQLYLQDDQGRRKKGTLSWGGMANTFWLIDREAELALNFSTQVIPPGDTGAREATTVVERGVYEKAGVKF